MVGIFSRFSSRSSHRRAQSAHEGRESLTSRTEAITGASASESAFAAPNGIEISTEFKPVDRPSEPLDSDQPIQCPLPEPSILNDGKIWKERVSSGAHKKGDMPVVQEEQTTSAEPGLPPRRPRPPQAIMPSISAPEHNILKLLDECSASGTGI